MQGGRSLLFKFMYYAELEHLLPGAQRGVGVRNPRFQSRLRVSIIYGYTLINPRRACAARVTVVVLCVCLSVCLYVCMYVCLSEHAILAVRAVRSITKDAIVLSVRFAAILKRRFS